MYHFSISHCGDYAAVMVSTECRVGVDIERITEKVKKVQHKFLSSSELLLIENLSASNSNMFTTLLTAAWGIKESLFKWYGDGEVDFIEHLHIEKIDIENNQGAAYCKVLKAIGTRLKVNFIFFNNNCLSWVLSA